MAPSHQTIKLLHGQRGGVAILFALFLPVLLGFAALAVDLARLNLTKVELQNAADAAALAGVRSLCDPSTVASDQPYNWSAATTTARFVAQCNFANTVRIQAVTIETGYWNLSNPALGLYHPGTPGAGDVAAIRATVAMPLQFLFAPILGISGSSVHASAIAVLPAAAAGTGLFPLVVSKNFLDSYWNSTTRSPILQNGVAPTISIGSTYNNHGSSQLTGTWTSFTNPANDVTTIRNLIANGNPTNLSIGMNIYIQPGAKATLYSEVPVGTDKAIFVVDNAATGLQPIVAIAGFHISGYNQGGKLVYGNFINNVSVGTTNPGNGNGVPYGAYTPPILVQ